MRALISGLINLETTVRVSGFPLAYQPVDYSFHGVRSTVSGVGFNIAVALKTLGHEANLLALIGDDQTGKLVRLVLHESGLDEAGVLSILDETAQSVILYDETGRRAVRVDLKDIQEVSYPVARFQNFLPSSDLAVLCNINYSRPFLKQATASGIPIATDVHDIADLEDDYNRDFMGSANILFMSDERLPCAPDVWIKEVQRCYRAEIIVIGMGSNGAILGVRGNSSVYHIPAVSPRGVVNTIGAGDALFSGFLHAYMESGDPYDSLRKAVYFAGYKVGATGAAEGFLDAKALDELIQGDQIGKVAE